jgi:hypothetical protein
MRHLRLITAAGASLVLALLLLGSGLPTRAAPTAAPLARSQGLLISEVYAPVGSSPAQQWFELYNMRTGAGEVYPLNGLILGTGTVSVTLQSTAVISPNSYLLVAFDAEGVRTNYKLPATRNIVEVPEPLKSLGLNPAADALILYSPHHMMIDEISWGQPNASWPNYNAGLRTANLPRLADRANSWGRTWPPGAPRDTDTGDGGDWTLHTTLTLGIQVIAPPQNGQGFLGGFTDWVGVISGLLLWAAFIIVGVIAYRFERLRETRTYWQLLLLAPSGILFYAIIVYIGFNQFPPVLTDEQKWLGFPILAASAVARLLAVAVFQHVARSLLEGE